MAPLKFEDAIKDKLEQSTIQPSNESWKKLEQQLDSQSNQKKIKKYWWLGIAASFVGFLLISTIFINTNERTNSSDIEIVDINKKVSKENQITDLVQKEYEEPTSGLEKNKNISEDIITSIVNENSEKEINILKINKNLENEIPKKHEAINAKNAFNNNVKEKVTVVQIDTIKEDHQLDELLRINKEDIDIEIANLVGQVAELQKNNITITDEEVDSLLRKAQLEITTRQILKSNTINASALLLDVESELDESFKEKVFETLKVGFEKLRTTVAERNN